MSRASCGQAESTHCSPQCDSRHRRPRRGMGATIQPPRPQTRPHYYSSRGNKYILRETDARTVGQEGPRHGKRNLVCENLSICQTVSNMVPPARSGSSSRRANRASFWCLAGSFGLPSSGAQRGEQLVFLPPNGPRW